MFLWEVTGQEWQTGNEQIPRGPPGPTSTSVRRGLAGLQDEDAAEEWFQRSAERRGLHFRGQELYSELGK